MHTPKTDTRNDCFIQPEPVLPVARGWAIHGSDQMFQKNHTQVPWQPQVTGPSWPVGLLTTTTQPAAVSYCARLSRAVNSPRSVSHRTIGSHRREDPNMARLPRFMPPFRENHTKISSLRTLLRELGKAVCSIEPARDPKAWEPADA